MISTANNNKNKVISIIAAVVLGAAVFGLQGCGGGGNDTPAVVPDVTLSSASVTEGNSGTTNLDFTVILSQATATNVTMSYSTSDGTAFAGEDYTATTGTLTVPANATSATITVPVTGDLVTEDDETFNLQITSAANGTIANSSITVAGDIVNDDLAGYYTGSILVNEGMGTLDLAGSEIQVIAANDRLVIINLTNNLVYIAPFTNFTQNSFVTTARIYKDGDFTTTTQISGTFITKASMNLILAGAGDYTTGTVTLAYSPKNSELPVVFATKDWVDDISLTLLSFTSNVDLEVITNSNTQAGTSISGCSSVVVSSSVITEQVNRLRKFSTTNLIGCDDLNQVGTSAEGYLTTFDDLGVDDRILFVWFNDNGVLATSLK